MKPLKVYEYLSRALCAMRRAPDAARDEWVAVIGRIERNCLPDGCGFNAGSMITGDPLADAEHTISIQTGYQHMNDAGYCTHWSSHTVTIRATFDGFDIDVTPGGEPEEFTEFLADTFVCALVEPMPENLKFKPPE